MFTLSIFSISCPASEKAGGAQEVGRKHSWPELAKGIFHTTEYHARYINWGVGQPARGCCLGTGRATAGKWWAIALFTTCFVYSNSFIIIIIIFLLFWPIKLSLSQSMNFLPFTLLILSPTQHEATWVSSYVVLSCQLGSNHNNQ